MTDHDHDQPTAVSTYDEQASLDFIAAVRKALLPLDKFRHPTSRQIDGAVHLVSVAADAYLQAARAAHIRTLADLERARQGNRELREEHEHEKAKDENEWSRERKQLETDLHNAQAEITDLSDRLRQSEASCGAVEAQRDQLAEANADLQGQLAIARDHTAGKAKTRPADPPTGPGHQLVGDGKPPSRPTPPAPPPPAPAPARAAGGRSRRHPPV